MKQTYMPCIDCAYGLQARHPSLENLWVWIAEGRTLEDPYLVVDPSVISEKYDLLEEMRFIVTHEDPPNYIVKLLGFREGSQIICVHRHMS